MDDKNMNYYHYKGYTIKIFSTGLYNYKVNYGRNWIGVSHSKRFKSLKAAKHFIDGLAK